MKETCDCGNIAKWLYMPFTDSKENPFYCDDCVPRGCSCNNRYVGSSYDFQDNGPDLSEDGVEGKDWKWLEEGKVWCYIDNQGRQFPCCEYDWEEEGYEKEE